MFSRGGQSQPKHSNDEISLDHRVGELEHVVDELETRLDAIETALAEPIAEPPAAASDPGDNGDARVHFLPLGFALRDEREDGEERETPPAEFTLEAPVLVDVLLQPPPAGTAMLTMDDVLTAIDGRVTEVLARAELAESRHAAVHERLDAVVHAVELLALRVDEVAHRQHTRVGELSPEPVANDHETVSALRDLQLAHAKLAREQARIEQLFRDDLAELADRVRRLARPLT